MKLHGSVKWWWSLPREEDPMGLNYREIAELDDKSMEEIPKQYRTELRGKQLAVIFGGRNKLTAAGPFLDLLAKFKEVLNKHSRLLVVGYSFRDEHVNQCIARWLGTGASRVVTIVEREGASAANNLFYRSRVGYLGERLTFEPTGTEMGIAKHFGNPG
jgi:hypothetical protein